MSEGPIKRERDAWKPASVSTPNAERICKKNLNARAAYCGRKPKVAVDDWALVTCADCLAAQRADVEVDS